MEDRLRSPLAMDIDIDLKKILGTYNYVEDSETFDIGYYDPPVFFDHNSSKGFELNRLIMKKQDGAWIIGTYGGNGGTLIPATDEVSEWIKIWILAKHKLVDGTILYPHPRDVQ